MHSATPFQGHVAGPHRTVTLGLGRLFYVFNCFVEFLLEHFPVVANAVQIGTGPGYALDDPTGLFDLLVIHPT